MLNLLTERGNFQAAGNDADEEVFYLFVERSAQESRHHDEAG